MVLFSDKKKKTITIVINDKQTKKNTRISGVKNE